MAEPTGYALGRALMTGTLRSGLPGLSGPVPHALAKAGIGAGGGYLAGKLLGWDERRTALLGGLAGGLTSIPDIVAQVRMSRAGQLPHNPVMLGLFDPYPYTQKKSMDLSWTLPGLPQGTQRMHGGLNPFAMPGHHISLAGAAESVLEDPHMTSLERAKALQLIRHAGDGEQRGLVTTGDLIRGGIGAGVGFTAANLAGRVLGALGGMPRQSRKRLSQVGAVAGLLRGTGIWSD